MIELPNKRYCCCFTGHRPEKLNIAPDLVVRRLDEAITAAMECGYTTFISGAAKGVDLWAAKLVLEHRLIRPDIWLVCAVPYKGFGLHWKDGYSELFSSITQAADAVHYVCDSFSRSAYQRRNEWMVDRSSLLIAAYTGISGGTRNTIEYAKRQEGCSIRYLELAAQHGPGYCTDALGATGGGTARRGNMKE